MVIRILISFTTKDMNLERLKYHNIYLNKILVYKKKRNAYCIFKLKYKKKILLIREIN